MGLRMAYWIGFAAVAGAFGGLIAFGVQHIHATVANWRLLFIIEVRHSMRSNVLPSAIDYFVIGNTIIPCGRDRPYFPPGSSGIDKLLQ